MNHETVYYYQDGFSYKLEYYGCKNIEFIFEKVHKDDDIVNPRVQAYIDSIIPEEERKILNEAKELVKDKKYRLSSIRILDRPAEFHVISKELGVGGTYTREDGYFSNAGDFLSSYCVVSCAGCIHKKDDTCSLKLDPYDPEIEDRCPSFMYDKDSKNILDNLIGKIK